VADIGWMGEKYATRPTSDAWVMLDIKKLVFRWGCVGMSIASSDLVEW